jgi:F0F1-type ATP synthase assembly protein I
VQLVPPQRRLRVFSPNVGDVLARGFEFAATIAIFFGIGFALDRWLGTTPVFMVVCFVFALVGQTVRAWYSFGTEIDRQAEARRQLSRPNADRPTNDGRDG